MYYTFITQDDSLAAVCEDLAQEKIIAVDLEADSMHSFTEKICLIQIAAGGQAWLVDPFEVSDFSSFARILEHPDIIKVLHGSDFDVRSLDREFSVEIHNLFDTEIACRFLNKKERGLGALMMSYFGIHLEKKYQKADWSKRPLKEEMVAYSVGDVSHLKALHDQLKAELIAIGRLEWAKEEFAHQAKVKYEPHHQLPLFKRFKGAGKLDNRTLAVLEHLLQVRLDMARKKDLPLFKIMSNPSIMAMARQRPRSVGEIIDMKALSKKQAAMYGTLCVNAVNTALNLPHKELPSYPRTLMPRKTPEVLNHIDMLKKMREKASAEMGMEPGFLLNNNLISAIAVAGPSDMAALGKIDNIRNWQVAVLGDRILKTLRRCA